MWVVKKMNGRKGRKKRKDQKNFLNFFIGVDPFAANGKINSETKNFFFLLE
jgi:hypothetical protein